jgi:hypothetical protein
MTTAYREWFPLDSAPHEAPVLVQFHAFDNPSAKVMQQVAWFFEGAWREYPRTEGLAYADCWAPLPIGGGHG